jgi:hypothetical protein
MPLPDALASEHHRKSPEGEVCPDIHADPVRFPRFLALVFVVAILGPGAALARTFGAMTNNFGSNTVSASATSITFEIRSVS